ncbi:hypothetical protein CR973_00375 [Candidatus Saccharibacteria bacterium]|nr:MAG: hypothetical protein CR973_00375 [Candidatus Saccharibacteria bacterium]
MITNYSIVKSPDGLQMKKTSRVGGPAGHSLGRIVIGSKEDGEDGFVSEKEAKKVIDLLEQARIPQQR